MPMYRASYEGISPEELSQLSTPIYSKGDGRAISAEFHKWKDLYTPEELVRRMIVVSYSDRIEIKRLAMVFINSEILNLEDKELTYARALIAYYPDRMPRHLAEVLHCDFDEMRELRKRLNIPDDTELAQLKEYGKVMPVPNK